MKKIFTNKLHLTIIITLLVISGVAHGYNMFQFPYYENDEGVYVSQAWSLITQQKLAPYTYWYDHAPAGWIFIALWSLLTGGFFTFDFSINSGRVFMLVLHVLSSLFLYLITYKLTKNKIASATSVLIFALSPLGIYFQRRVLLDNIMVFWTLLSITYLQYYRNKLRNVFFSAIAFALAVLSKETAVFFAPVLAYIAFHEIDKKHRLFGLIGWVTIFGMVVSLYFLYALLKGEFFPYGTALGGDNPHVSLIEALKFQASRPGGNITDFENSSFWYNLRVWISEDAAIIYVGITATILNIILGIKNYAARVAGLLSGFMWFYFMRGGLVIEFYVIPLIPLLALNIAVLAWILKEGIKKLGKNIFVKSFSVVPQYATLIVMVALLLHFSTNVRNILNIYTSDQTTVQRQAVDWLLEKEIAGATYIVDNYGYVDLQVRKKDPTVKYEWYWKVDRDPDVRDDILKNSAKNIDYIALTPQMKNDIAFSGLGLTLAGWKHSRPVTIFSQDRWEVDIWANTDPKRILEGTWESYKKHYIVDGRVIDPYVDNMTTSEAQSYALLRAVWMNDKRTFDEIYNWSNLNLWQENGLYAWKWNNGQIQDNGFAPDADQDIALALIFASSKWNDTKYLNDAKKLISAIWNESIVTIKNDSYLVAGPWADQEDQLIINPSYLSPASYKIFAEVDSKHDWKQVTKTSYTVLENCTETTIDGKKGVLPPEWCGVNKLTQKVKKPEGDVPSSSEYGYNAFRIPWRIALDYKWYNDERAYNYLQSLTFLNKEWTDKQKIAAVYTHNGEVWEDYETVAAYGGNLAYYSIFHPTKAKQIYEEKILKKLYEDREKSYWDDPKNYYTQNWAWFGTAFYGNQLLNLWKQGSKITRSN